MVKTATPREVWVLRVDLTWIVHSILVLLNMRSSTHFSSVTATLFSLNAKHISSNLERYHETGPSLKLSSFLSVASGVLQWVCSINSQCKRGEFSIYAF